MYTDPNVSGLLFQAFAAVLAAVTGILFVLSRKVRAKPVRVRQLVRNTKSKRDLTRNRKAEE